MGIYPSLFLSRTDKTISEIKSVFLQTHITESGFHNSNLAKTENKTEGEKQIEQEK
jgi:hypothetical protein